MIQFQCPFCATNLSAPSEYKGKKVRCHSCQKKFVLSVNEPEPDPTGLPAAEPFPAPASVPSNFKTSTVPRKPKRKRGKSARSFTESDSWSTLFDLSFNSWIAPKICSLLYLCSVIGFVIYSVIFTGLFVLSTVGIGAAQQGPPGSFSPNMAFNGPQVTGETHQIQQPLSMQTPTTIQVPVLAQFNQPNFNQPNFGQPQTIGGGSKLVAFLFSLLTYVLVMLGLFFGIMFSRLIFETILAQFYC